MCIYEKPSVVADTGGTIQPHSKHQHRLFGILPPHILPEIANRGTAAQRSRVLNTLASDHTMRFARASHLMRAIGARKRVSAAPASAEPQVSIYDAHHRMRLPGTLVGNPGSSSDPAVSEAYNGLLATFNLYCEVYQRNSIDDQGMPLIGSVHYRRDYDNAFFNGQQMVFGDGDGEIFQRFTIAVDIMGHELTHGVTGATANLDYQDQSGALNESMSDVFGSLVKQYCASPQQRADEADWLIGAGIFMPEINGVALRSMSAPGTTYDDPTLGKDPQPADMAHYVETDQDNGGVHINSGIPNRAFYLAAMAFGGYAWEQAGRIWYATLLDPALQPNASFDEFAQLSMANAEKLFGMDGKKLVMDAWQTVGVS
jgi:Zn-dependent metalloprotease